MQTKTTVVDGKEILLDGEGYLLDLDEWSENFVTVRAEEEGLELTSEHWEIIRYIREYYELNNVQAPVRDMIKHFKKTWGKEKANTRYLHKIFPLGGPQKQGNRLAGVRKPKGEH
ncbi:MAG TPA: TusE/DsrC/DsvC family sulfur relay protein [Gammaproteobacteria bacterium]|nr:TusE/DsrC/DsvC family sulfur relay protein [Gammaproteobacteria bacterium]